MIKNVNTSALLVFGVDNVTGRKEITDRIALLKQLCIDIPVTFHSDDLNLQHQIL